MDVLKQQYELVRSTRELLFQFCEQISPEDYVKEIEGFGWGSIRNLHVHVAECYLHWLNNIALNNSESVLETNHVSDVNAMRDVFVEVDQLVERFLQTFESRYNHIIKEEPTGDEFSVLWLFTHTITHEFHHKGQIVSMARHFGYTPIDTDLIVPS